MYQSDRKYKVTFEHTVDIDSVLYILDQNGIPQRSVRSLPERDQIYAVTFEFKPTVSGSSFPSEANTLSKNTRIFYFVC